MSMNIEKLFDFMVANKEAAGAAFSFGLSKGKALVQPRVASGIIQKSLQAFFHNVGQEENEKSIQAFQGSSALPQLTKDVFNVTMQVNEFDLLWQKAYRTITLKKGQLDWEIANVVSGLAFKQIPEGGKVEFEKISGSKTSASILKYGAGLGITWETIEGRKLYKFVQQMEDARAKLYDLWANSHYGALATAGLANPIAWQGVATDRTIDRDILTLNLGAYSNGLANKDKGYGDTANARFELYCDPNLRARVNAALRATSANVTMAGGTATGVPGVTVDFRINPNYTFNSAITANKALLVLPGQKIQNSIYMREMGMSQKEIESLNEMRTYWTAFGLVVADTDQVYELSFA